MLRDLWKYISYLGISDGLRPFDKKSVTLLNQVSFVMLIWFGFMALLSAIVGRYFEFALAFSNVVFFGLVLILNAHHWIKLAKHYYCIFGLSMVSFVNILYPSGPFPLVQFITTAIFPVLLFKKNRMVLIYLAATLAMLFLVIYYHSLYEPLLPPEHFASPPNHFSGMMIVMIIIFLIILFFRRVGDDQERLLMEKNRYLNDLIVKTKSMQEQLINSEKMASLGQLTAGIAHEINNPINFVSSNINPLKRDLEDIKDLCRRYNALHTAEDPVAELVEIGKYAKEIDPAFLSEEIDTLIKGIEEGANRTKQIVLDLRNFSRLDEDEFKSTDIHEGIDSTLMLLTNKIKNRIDVVKDYGNLPPIDCMPGKINQVLMNILNNAAEAIQDQGTITIKTTHDKKKKTIVISLKDDGIGMSLAVSRRIFEPFYTTKSIGKGTGLGLSISYGIVEKHRGTLEVKSEKGRGSEFIVTLPVYQSNEKR